MCSIIIEAERKTETDCINQGVYYKFITHPRICGYTKGLGKSVQCI